MKDFMIYSMLCLVLVDEGVAEPAQPASLRFFLPVVCAYLLACGGWIALAKLKLVGRPRTPFPISAKPWLDLGLGGIAVVGILVLGCAFRSGWLLPRGPGSLSTIYWTLNNLIIFSPVFIVVAVRRQGLETLLLPRDGVLRDAVAGIALGVASAVLYLGLRGEVAKLPAVLSGVVDPKNVANFVPVFLEGVGLAFLFVRIRWAIGHRPALLISGFLFAAAHIPRQMAASSPLGTIIAFFILNMLLVPAILHVTFLSRSILWIGMVHYVLDVATRAFE